MHSEVRFAAKRIITLAVTVLMIFTVFMAYPAQLADAAATNYAIGSSYTVSRLTYGGNTEDGTAIVYASDRSDASSTKMNDSAFGNGESTTTAGYCGTGRTFRFKFDFGSTKTGIYKVILKNLIHDYPTPSNRGYDTSKFAVSTGTDSANMKAASVSVTKTNLTNAYAADVTLTFTSVSARYVNVDLGAYGTDTAGAYVLALDEIQIFGDSTPAPTSKPSYDFEIDVSAPEKADQNEQFNVTVFPKSIVNARGIVALDFILKFDNTKVTPVYTADTSYSQILTTNPNNWVDIGCYYNATESAYYFRYAADEKNTSVDGLKADKAICLTIPFKVNSTTAYGTQITFSVKDCIATDPGDALWVGFDDIYGDSSDTAVLTVIQATTVTTKTTSTTVKPTNSTVNSTTPTVKPTNSTVTSTEPTVKPTGSTVTLTEPTVKSTGSTATSTEPIVKPTGSTVTSTEPTVKPTGSTINSTTPTVKSTGSTVKPTEPTVKPTGSTVNSTTPTVKPTEPTETKPGESQGPTLPSKSTETQTLPTDPKPSESQGPSNTESQPTTMPTKTSSTEESKPTETQPTQIAEKLELVDASSFALENNKLAHVPADCDKKTVEAQIKNKTIRIIDLSAEEIDKDDALIGTGFAVQLINSNGNVVDSALVIVLGDVDGTGVVNSTDYISIKRHLIRQITLVDEFLAAADTDASGKVDSTDFIMIKRHFLHTYNLYA